MGLHLTECIRAQAVFGTPMNKIDNALSYLPPRRCNLSNQLCTLRVNKIAYNIYVMTFFNIHV